MEDAHLMSSPLSEKYINDHGEIGRNKDLTPVMGMKFRCYEDAREFYNRYALGVGFGTKIKSSWHNKKTKEKYHGLFVCCREGSKDEKKNALYRRPTKKTGCGAYMRVKLTECKKWEVIGVHLDHNHAVSPSKERRCSGGHENLHFGERDVRNYVGVYKRLKLAEGDAEAMHIYFTRMQQRNSNFFYLMDLDNEGHLRNISLKEFVDQYDSALRDKYEKEVQAGFESFYTKPVLKTHCYFEVQIAEIYTREMFMKFQEEVCGMVCCSKSVVKVDGSIITFAVKERVIGKNGKNGKVLGPKVYEVLFNTSEVEVRCICNLFEHKSILCKHSLCVLNDHMDEIPSQYILLRWKKDFKRKYVSNLCSKNVQAVNPVQRYDVLYPQALQILDEGVISEASYNIVLEGLQELLKKFQKTNDNCYNNGNTCGDVETNVISDTAQQDFTGYTKICDPLKAKRPGRPKKNRLQSSSERNIKKNGKKGQIAPTYSSLDVPERIIDIQPNMQWGNQQREDVLNVFQEDVLLADINATQKHPSFGFATFLDKEAAAAAMDNTDNAELYG
ncbi:hypothetical protein HHK36_015512 [Tetracentron sinense]|uniref:Protein FAR1-RELATED SEQUENCE n=1 Tax=Tetracentron sinense TaxID=13715 RepID=A0A835DDQ3_TETSI|nr:hypothetical protein HHK36_015512 [Tetracentron sinense]